MLFNTVINIDTSTSMIHSINTCTLCLLLLLPVFMMNNTLSNIANINAHNSTITPSTSFFNEISMVNAVIPAIIINTYSNPCRTCVTTLTTTIPAQTPNSVGRNIWAE